MEDAAVSETRSRLLSRFHQLLSDREIIWSSILEKQHICTVIISEQALVNEKFTEFHNMYMEISRSWPPEFQNYGPFRDLSDEVDQLSDWMSSFESKVQDALTTLEEMTEFLRQKLHELNELLPQIAGSNDLTTLQEIDLDNFIWVDESRWPDTNQLDEEWRDKDAFRIIDLCVMEITQLFNTPETVLVADLEFMGVSSSSNSDSSGAYRI